jgi:hypothetical protein
MGALILTEKEQRHLANPLNHKIQVHARTYVILLGGCLFLSGIGYLALAMHCHITALLSDLAWLIGTCLVTGWVALPCKCGKVPLLAARTRSNIARGGCSRRELLLLAVIIAAAVALTAGVGIYFMLQATQLLGLQALSLGVGGSLMVIGCLLVVASALDKLPRRDVISQRIQDEVGSLQGNTEAELNKLIDFHLQTGNFDDADACSKKLLTLAEDEPCT